MTVLAAGSATAKGAARINNMELLHTNILNCQMDIESPGQGQDVQKDVFLCMGAPMQPIRISWDLAHLPGLHQLHRHVANKTRKDLCGPNSAANWQFRICAVSPEQLHGEGAVISLAAHEGGAKPREAVLLLTVHEESGAAVWDAR